MGWISWWTDEVSMMVIGAVISALIGGVISFLITYCYYKKAGNELRDEAAKLRNLHELTLYAFFNRNAKVEPRYDANGKIVGIIVGAVGSAIGFGAAKGAPPDSLRPL